MTVDIWVSLEKEFKRSAGALQLRWSELHSHQGGAVNLESDGESRYVILCPHVGLLLTGYAYVSLDFDDLPKKTAKTQSTATSRKLFGSQDLSSAEKGTNHKQPEHTCKEGGKIREDETTPHSPLSRRETRGTVPSSRATPTSTPAARVSLYERNSEMEDEEASMRFTEGQRKAMRSLGTGSPIIDSDGELMSQRRTERTPEQRRTTIRETYPETSIEMGKKERGHAEAESLQQWVERRRQINFELYGQHAITPDRNAWLRGLLEERVNSSGNNRTPRISTVTSQRRKIKRRRTVDSDRQSDAVSFLMNIDNHLQRSEITLPRDRVHVVEHTPVIDKYARHSEWQVVFGPGKEHAGGSRMNWASEKGKERDTLDREELISLRKGLLTNRRRSMITKGSEAEVIRTKRRGRSLGADLVDTDGDFIKRIEELSELLSRKREEEEERRRRRQEEMKRKEEERRVHKEQERKQVDQLYMFWQEFRGRL